MIDERAERTIERSVEEVFSFMSDLARLPEWVAGVKAARPLQGDPRSVGATVAHVNEFMGRTFESTFEVLEWEPNRSMVFKVLSGPLKGESRETLEPLAPNVTRVEVRVLGEPAGPFRLMRKVVGVAARQQLEVSLDNLKRHLERESRNDSRTGDL